MNKIIDKKLSIIEAKKQKEKGESSSKKKEERRARLLPYRAFFLEKGEIGEDLLTIHQLSLKVSIFLSSESIKDGYSKFPKLGVKIIS